MATLATGRIPKPDNTSVVNTQPGPQVVPVGNTGPASPKTAGAGTAAPAIAAGTQLSAPSDIRPLTTGPNLTTGPPVTVADGSPAPASTTTSTAAPTTTTK